MSETKYSHRADDASARDEERRVNMEYGGRRDVAHWNPSKEEESEVKAHEQQSVHRGN